mmetsp:Transcript_6523/g.9837  ORF Transcript_6523/g.9837 Transcript_6523/m.9837 type:complete len:174 (+) Transcript_6523:319-840(+)
MNNILSKNLYMKDKKKNDLRKMEPARVGRTKQRYEKYVRLITGCVPILRSESEGLKIVLVTSSRNEGWILPKGGWENDESSEEGAAREAYEEAGVMGVISSTIGTFSYIGKQGKEGKAVMYILEVNEMLERWPESFRRQRRMVGIEEANNFLFRPEQRDVISKLMKILVAKNL